MINRPSHTAADVAVLRALSSIAPQHRRLLHDPLSLAMIPAPWGFSKPFFSGPFKRLTFHISNLISDLVSGMPGGADLVALRYRWIDDRLRQAVADGIEQVLLLGAGYDFRPYRPQYRHVHFIEIDHPQTQAAKLKVLRRHQVQARNVSHLAVDFMGDWQATVAASSLLQPMPTLVIWEGVIYYLDPAAIDYTLRALQQLLPAGGQLVFDSMPPAESTQELGRTARYVAKKGEPLRWGGSMDDSRTLLERHGYSCDTMETLNAYLHRLRHQQGVRAYAAPILRQFYLVAARWPAQS